MTFISSATNLVPNTNLCDRPDLFFHCAAIYVRDARTGRTERVDVDSYGQPRKREADFGLGQVISGNGRYVAYGSIGANAGSRCPVGVSRGDVQLDLPVSGPCSTEQAFFYDRFSGTMEWVTKSRSGREPVKGRCYPTSLTASSAAALGGISRNGRLVSFASCGQDVVAGDTNDHVDVFVRDRGLDLGSGGIGKVVASPPDDGCVVELVCLPAREGDADLIAARLVPRPSLHDVFVRLDVAQLPRLVGVPTGGLLYGVRFSAGGTTYEVRAQRVAGADYDAVAGASFGLFRESLPGAWTKVATLKGGYGTVGEAVVTALPLSLLGGKARLTDVTAYSAVGSYHSGATTVLDSLELTR